MHVLLATQSIIMVMIVTACHAHCSAGGELEITILTYECTFVGGSETSTTVWQLGTAFNPNECMISLVHSQFGTERAFGRCNDESIVGRGIRAENNSSYTSQLNVTVSCDMIGKKFNIECVHDDGRTSTTIENTTLNLGIMHDV